MNDLATAEKTAQEAAQEDWAHIQALFKARSVMRPKAAWFNGVSSRLSRRRLERLTQSPSARTLKDYLADKTPNGLKTLRTFAAVNLEQASSAFRLTMIANITVPIVLLSVLHQLSPNGLGQLIKTVIGDDSEMMLSMIIGGLGGIIVLILLISYALANLGQARDLRHLLDIYAAERGIYFGLEDKDDLQIS